MPDGVRRRPDLDLLPTQEDAPCAPLVGAEDRPHRLGPARAHETGDAQDLALPDGEVDRRPIPGVAQPLDAQQFRPQRHLGAERVALAEHAPDHRRHHLPERDVGDAVRGCHPAVSQHRHSVADLEHLVQMMGDVEDSDATTLEAADDLEEAVDLLRRQGCSRFVQDEDSGLAGERLGDLNELHLCDAEFLYERPGRDVESDFLKQRTRPCLKPCGVDEPKS